ncbi:MAG: helix-turn-helix domain-containing protein [Actinomycetota bacterium]|nr:helix-turn-helix domain-containing protein [Actinomycetota bacterium]
MKRPQRSQPMGPKSVRGSETARRLAALMMEAWSGVRSTQAACAAMGISVTRFYQLEARAVQEVVSALEPRPRGRRLTAASELGKCKLENQRLRRDLERFQSLYRTAQRTLGVVVAKPVGKADNPAPGGKRKRGPRRKARGQAVAAVLLRTAMPDGAREASDAATEQGSGSRGRVGGRPGGQVAAEGGAGHADG